MTDDETVKLCLAAWNNVGLDHPTVKATRLDDEEYDERTWRAGD